MTPIDNTKYVNVLSRESATEMPVRGGIGGAVISVNGKTGVVELTAEDVGAMPFMKAIEGELTVPYEKIAGYAACQNQYWLTSVNIPNAKSAFLSNTFLGCMNLEEIKGCDNLESGYLYRAFRDNSSLNTVPRFQNFVNPITDSSDRGDYRGAFQETFYNCTSLKTLPSGMFPKLKMGHKLFYNAFAYSGLESLPEDFLENLVDSNIEDFYMNWGFFYGAFQYTKLRTLPPHLFGEMQYVPYQCFLNCFLNCNDLEEIPDTLFDNIIGWHESDYDYGSGGFRGMFSQCISLTGSVIFRKLTRIGATMFQQTFGGTKITSLSFPALTPDSFEHANSNSFLNMLAGVNGCTVHFPANVQSVIGNWASVAGGFSGTNTTVLFDLPNVE